MSATRRGLPYKALAAIGVVLALLVCGAVYVAAPPPESTSPQSAPGAALEAMRKAGDMPAQRGHVWKVIADLTRSTVFDGRSQPVFETWYGEDAVFADADAAPVPRGIRGFSRVGQTPAMQSPGAPVLTYTLYNEAAYRHIRAHRLDRAAELDRLLKEGPADHAIAANRSVPQFPTSSVVLKTVWWPVAKTGVTALPVWDPQDNPASPNGNSYTSWRRVVAVDPSGQARKGDTMAIDFAGRTFARAPRLGLESFYHITVDARMAQRMMLDPESQKAALIALGRPLQPGDTLLLVGANLATREITDWVWGAFWWHDQPAEGPFAAGRPAVLPTQWRHYLMDAALDFQTPVASDGGAHICFNPWLEGRFPDNGHGGGTVSNCMACHSRASYPAVGFLPVTRGAADLREDPAYAPGRLRTSSLWSLAMHAKP